MKTLKWNWKKGPKRWHWGEKKLKKCTAMLDDHSGIHLQTT